MPARKPSLAPTAGWVYDLVLRLFAPLLDLFFREIQVRGAWRVPSQGAVILVAAPHANQVCNLYGPNRSTAADWRLVCGLLGADASHALAQPPGFVAYG